MLKWVNCCKIAITLIGMKWFFLVGFVAAIFCAIFWTGVIVFAMATHRLAAMGVWGIAFLAPLPFFIWGALEMFRSFRDTGRSR